MKDIERFEKLGQRIAPICCEVCRKTDLDVLDSTGDLGQWWTDHGDGGLTLCDECKGKAAGTAQ